MLSGDREFTEVRPGIFGATEDTEQLTVTVYRYEPGCEWETHAHPEDQVTYVDRGRDDRLRGRRRARPRCRRASWPSSPAACLHSASVPADGERVITLNVWRLRG